MDKCKNEAQRLIATTYCCKSDTYTGSNREILGVPLIFSSTVNTPTHTYRYTLYNYTYRVIILVSKGQLCFRLAQQISIKHRLLCLTYTRSCFFDDDDVWWSYFFILISISLILSLSQKVDEISNFIGVRNYVTFRDSYFLTISDLMAYSLKRDFVVVLNNI